jgi:hypothetical protein
MFGHLIDQALGCVGELPGLELSDNIEFST